MGGGTAQDLSKLCESAAKLCGQIPENKAMIETVFKIDGMMCTMCEAHVKDAIRKSQPDADHIDASHKKGEARVRSRAPLDEAAVIRALSATGYRVLSHSSSEYQPKGFFAKLFG
jgi:copper chaperone CopZ